MTDASLLSRLKQLRESHAQGLTQAQLALRLGVTEDTVANWESGRTGVEWFRRVAKLCDVLECSPSDLFSEITPTNSSHCIVIAVAGGSAAGKTTLCEALRDYLGDKVTYIEHDWYYKDSSQIKDKNWDQPDALRNDDLLKHLRLLLANQDAELPGYDMTNHRSSEETKTATLKPVILLDGLLTLAIPKLRPLIDFGIFVEAEGSIRLARRLRRDTEKRNREWHDVLEQFDGTVNQMHELYVEPSKKYANMVISGEKLKENLDREVQNIVQKLRSRFPNIDLP
ncbi:MAG: helix-turn-helix domain-containing protein [Anaerolineae bacterium]|nr:helix-turn-helix domain-containing protein [Gloeobacterales cyanobacterium ES-bin-313]